MKKILILTIGVLLLFSGPTTAAKRFGLNFCHDPNFKCVKVKRGQSWERMFPDPYQRQVVRRLNRMNTRIYAGMKIAVPIDLENTDLMDISPFPHTISSPGEKLVVVDPGALAFGAYDADGNLVHWGPISGGKSYCRDIATGCRTVSGKYRFYHKKGAGCRSKKFPVGRGGAKMPYCMYFHGGYALHASSEVPGYHASHGCVRIFEEDAKWLNTEFIDMPKVMNDIDQNRDGTRVIVNTYN